MKAPGWGLVLLATIVTAFVTPVWGQANSGTRSAASIPNFSGNWSHLFFPDVDLPLSGPGPVTNKARLPSGVSNPGRLVGDHTNPILKPEAAEVVRKHG